jgi:hypothetical protein
VDFIFVDLSTEMISATRQSPYFCRTQIYHGKKISTNHGNNSNSSSDDISTGMVKEKEKIIWTKTFDALQEKITILTSSSVNGLSIISK